MKFLLSIFLLSSGMSFSQDTRMELLPMSIEENSLGIMVGASQWDYTYLELGIAHGSGVRSMCAFGSYFRAISASVEWRPYPNPNNLGFLVSYMSTSGLPISLGMNIHSYTDFKHANLGFRPMIGFGGGHFQLVYGYNFQVVRRDDLRLNTHQITARWFLPIFDLYKD